MIQFTDNEKQFVRKWKKLFPTPKDWSETELKQGTSSFLNWREWFKDHQFSIDLCCKVLDQFVDNKFPPTFKQVKFEYNRKVNKVSDSKVDKDCSCLGIGIRYIIQDCGRKGWPIIPPTATDPEMIEPKINSVPCDCEAGNALNNKSYTDSEGDQKQVYGYSMQMLNKLQRCSFTSRMEALNFIHGPMKIVEDNLAEMYSRLQQKAGASR